MHTYKYIHTLHSYSLYSGTQGTSVVKKKSGKKRRKSKKREKKNKTRSSSKRKQRKVKVESCNIMIKKQEGNQKEKAKLGEK